MSYSLSGNMDREATRFKWATQQGLSPDRINTLMPSFDSARFPTVLSTTNIAPPYGPNISSLVGDSTAPRDERSDTLPADAVIAALAQAMQWESTLRDSTLREGAGAVPEEAAPAAGSCSGSWWHAMLTAATGSAASPGVLGESLGLSRSRQSGVARFGSPRIKRRYGASNDWVVGGNRTASGLPLLSNDPHLSFYAPSVWILNHISVPPIGKDVIGASFVGVPGVVLGHNSFIAWGVTNTGADVQDLYIMTEPPGDDTQYLVNGSFVPYTIRNEVVKVKGNADVIVRVRVSIYGPVVTDNGVIKGINTPLSMRWISTDATTPDTTLDAFLGLQSATDWTSFRAALSTYIAPSQNFVYADKAGNFGYQMSGAVPQRNPGAGYTGAWPSPGDGNETFVWGPRIPFDAMPRTYNPPEGFIATANNRVTPAGYPLFITADWDEGSDGYRASRISDMIVSGSPVNTVSSMQAIQQDTVTYLARDIAAIVNATVPLASLSAGGMGMRWLLLTWDLDAHINAPTATLWAQVWRQLSTLGDVETGGDHGADFVFMLNALQSDTAPGGTDPACTRLGTLVWHDDLSVRVAVHTERRVLARLSQATLAAPPSLPPPSTRWATATISLQTAHNRRQRHARRPSPNGACSCIRRSSSTSS